MAPTDLSFRGTSRFELIRQLGAGGMGVVYEALDRDYGTRVALKALHHLDPNLLFRLKSEFRSLQGIVHPNLATLLELIHDTGHTFFTMELVDGTRLTQYVRPGDGAPPPDSDTVADPISAVVTFVDPTPGEPQPPSLPPVREPLYDERRLRSSLAQLADAIAALHRAGKVHRDIKPSNVLVTRPGRVVVLDFGLVTDIGGERQSGSHVVGTVDYMAPEQAAGRAVGPEADWYSMGIILYQILTGWLPYSGAPLTILQDKQHLVPRPPTELADCPHDLAELCSALVRIDPAARPPEAEILRRLSSASAASVARENSWPSAGQLGGTFVGRARELAQLHDAFENARSGIATVALVEGLSGVGKSALVRQFTARLADRVPELVVLTGRYYEREALPYRALDTIMDAVSRFLLRLPSAAVEALLPVDVGLLATLFPSLRAVEAISHVPYKPTALDPQELRARQFRAVRELFLRLGQRRPVVLVIEDVQWSDSDSRAAFADIMRPPDGPALLTIATLRTAPELPVAMQISMRYFRQIGKVVQLELESLPPDEARELAARLLGRDSVVSPEAIAAEADGHPLFIDALARHALMVGPYRPGALRLDDALGATIDSLDAQGRLVLELVCTSGSPLANDLAARSAGLEPPTMTRVLTALKTVHLLRATRVHDHDAAEPYHDRVRELVLRAAGPAIRLRHEALARALEAAPSPDAEALFTHWRAAGDTTRAVRYGTHAAQRANETLGFDRAAILYRDTLALCRDPGQRRRLWLGLGEALANAGRGPDAADAFAEAATGAPAHEALDLRRRMAEQLLRSGRIDTGLAAVREVLAAVGLRMPRTPRSALAALVWNRGRLRLRGLGYRERATAEVPPANLVRLDACWSVAGVLGMVDTIRGAYFQTLHLRLALEAGEPFRVARALALEAGFSATAGNVSAPRTKRLVEQSDALAVRLGEPYLLGWVRGAAGVAAALEGRWQTGLELTTEAEEIFRNRCGGTAWELGTFQFFHMYSLAYMGRMRALVARVPRALREAEDRGDLYTAAAHRTALSTMAWLATDDVAVARERVREAMRHWSRAGGFKVEHFWELLAESQNDLYAGDVEPALERMRARWPALEASLLLRVQLSRLEAIHVRARVALAAAAATARERAFLLDFARRDARRIARERTRWATPMADLLHAGADALDGRLTDAAVTLRRAMVGFEAAEMHLYAAAARWRLGEILGATDGGVLAADARKWMRGEGIAAPARMLAMLAPGFAPGG